MPAAKAWKTKRELAKRMNAINLKRRKANLEASQEDNDTVDQPTRPDNTTNNGNESDIEELTGKLTTFERELSLLNQGSSVCNSNYSGNRIVHWDSLQLLVESNMMCKKCGGDVSIRETTVGIATEVNLACKYCNIKKTNNVRRTDSKKYKFRSDSSESYTLNCQFVLALM